MEGASLRGCNFEDPTGTRAHLEGENNYAPLFFLKRVKNRNFYSVDVYKQTTFRVSRFHRETSFVYSGFAVCSKKKTNTVQCSQKPTLLNFNSI